MNIYIRVNSINTIVGTRVSYIYIYTIRVLPIHIIRYSSRTYRLHTASFRPTTRRQTRNNLSRSRPIYRYYIYVYNIIYCTGVWNRSCVYRYYILYYLSLHCRKTFWSFAADVKRAHARTYNKIVCVCLCVCVCVWAI